MECRGEEREVRREKAHGWEVGGKVGCGIYTIPARLQCGVKDTEWGRAASTGPVCEGWSSPAVSVLCQRWPVLPMIPSPAAGQLGSSGLVYWRSHLACALSLPTAQHLYSTQPPSCSSSYVLNLWSVSIFCSLLIPTLNPITMATLDPHTNHR